MTRIFSALKNRKCEEDPSAFAICMRRFVALTNTSTASSVRYTHTSLSRNIFMLRQASWKEDEATVNGKYTQASHTKTHKHYHTQVTLVSNIMKLQNTIKYHSTKSIGEQN